MEKDYGLLRFDGSTVVHSTCAVFLRSSCIAVSSKRSALLTLGDFPMLIGTTLEKVFLLTIVLAECRANNS